MGPVQNHQIKQITPQSLEAEQEVRLGTHPAFQTDDFITHTFSINKEVLYFQPYNPKHTFATLSQQYELYTGVPLILADSEVEISPQLPISRLTQRADIEQEVESILQTLQQHKPIIRQQMSPPIIEEQNNPVCSIFKKSKNFVKFDDKPIESDSCQIIINFNGGDLSIKQIMLINSDTTFRHVITFATQKLKARLNEVIPDKIVLQNMLNEVVADSSLNSLEIQDQYQNIVEPSRYLQRLIEYDDECFQKMDKKRSELFVFHFFSGSCVFSLTSEIRLSSGSITVEDYVKAQQNIPVEILVFDRGTRQLVVEKNHQLKFPIEQEVNKYQFISIKLLTDNDEYKTIAVFKRTLVMLDNFEWVHAENVKVGMNILGVSQGGYLIPFRVKSMLQKAHTSEKVRGIHISSPRCHNLIVDGIIVHNRNTLTLNCNFISQSSKYIKVQNVFNDSKVDDYFQGKACYFAGRKMQGSETFGDYQMQNGDAIYVFEDESNYSEVVISQRQKDNIHYFPVKQIANNYLGKLREDFLGVNSKGIIGFEDIAGLPEERGVSHILVHRRSLAERNNYFRHVEPVYRSHEKEICMFYQSQDNEINYRRAQFQYDYRLYRNGYPERPPLSEQQFLAIRLYTSNQIYSSLNSFLRNSYGKKSHENQHKKWIATVGWIMKSLQSLPDYDGVCFRGISKTTLSNCLGVTDHNQSVHFRSFTSTTMSREVALDRFCRQGVLLTIHCRTGKDITSYSQFKTEKEVLLPPFTHFAIMKYDQQASPQTATLQEIPLPATDCQYLVFWVDDNPMNNVWIAKKIREKGVEVVQITSTRIMAIIIRQFFWIYKVLGKQVVIITDMGRDEDGQFNPTAGVDLLYLIYNVHGLSLTSFVYALNIKDCQQKIRERQVESNRYFIQDKPHKLISEVLEALHCPN